MDTGKIIKKLSSDRYNREVFSRVDTAYMVGGFIRDKIIGRKSKDRDYIVEDNPYDVAAKISKDFSGTLVTFKEESTVRVALEDGITLDFSRIIEDIKTDLCSRDFTVNSIAFNPQHGILDFSGGFSDIQKGIIRTNHKNNIFNDPLRCLRAYRMMSELGWDIDGKTKEIMFKAKTGLRHISTERITLEFFKMINGDHCFEALKECRSDSILKLILSWHINEIEHNIEKILEVDGFLEKLPSNERKNNNKFFSHNLTYRGMVRLERLLYGIDLIEVRLSFSRQIMRRLLKAGKFLDELKCNKVKIDIFDAFFSSKDMIYDLVCLSGRKELLKDARRFIHINKNKMLSSSDIMDLTGIRGKSFGHVLYCLDRERFYGRVRTRAQAEDFLRDF